MTDEQIQKIISGDREAFKQLVELFQKQITSVCSGYVRNKETAEDLAQDVFVEVFRSIKNFRSESKISTWIYRIAITKCIDHTRKEKSKKRFGSIKQLFGIESKSVLSLPSKDINPAKEIEDDERRRILYDALERIPESQRIAITLHKIEELNHAEIAKIMGVSVSAVESSMHRGKVNLRKQLHKYFEKKA